MSSTQSSPPPATMVSIRATTSPGSKLRIRRATPSDVPDLVRVNFDAFGPGVLDRLIYPDGGSESARAKFAKTFFPEPEDSGSEKPPASSVEQIVMVAELMPDSEEEQRAPPEIVAFGKWELVKEPLDKAQWTREVEVLTAEQLGEGSNADVYNTFIGGLHRLKRKWMRGDPGLRKFWPFCFDTDPAVDAQTISDLGILACATTRQRSGTGTALLAWGNEFADKRGIVHWLEASPAGYPLYKRFGFDGVEVQDLNVTEMWGPVREEDEDWGGNSAVELAGELPEGVFRTVVMRRFPTKL